MNNHEYTKQHIVPQCYLNRFAVPRKNSFQVGCRLKKNGSYFPTTVDKVGYIKDYYDVECRDDKKHWEKTYSQEIDPMFSHTLDEIIYKINRTPINSIEPVLTDEDKFNLGFMIASQTLRVPEWIDARIYEYDGWHEKWVQNFIKTYKNVFSDEALDFAQPMSFTESQKKDEVIKWSIDKHSLDLYAYVLSNRVWYICLNKTSIPFFTSDNPVILYNFEKETYDHSQNGFQRDESTIIFPLSPSIAIMISGAVGDYHPRNGGIFPMFAPNLAACQFIYDCNQVQFEKCYQHLIIPYDYFLSTFKDKQVN